MPTSLRDEIVNCMSICEADYASYMLDLPEKDQRLISLIRRKMSKGMEPWYPLTRRYLGKLVYNVSVLYLFTG